MPWPNDYARIRVSDTPMRDFFGRDWMPTEGSESHFDIMVPLLHRTLTDLSCVHRVPAMPSGHLENIYYWEGAYHLVTLAMGWTNPLKGMRSWYEAGKPVEEPVLKLLADVYDCDNQLDNLYVHLWNAYNRTGEAWWVRLPGIQIGDEITRSRESIDNNIIESVRNKFAQDKRLAWPYAPTEAGWNPLHLGHVLYATKTGTPATLATTAHEDRAAVVLCHDPKTWYGDLCMAAHNLPDLGEQSWYVDVVVKRWGWMGTFRRSRETGLWFLGKHSTHMMGN